MSELALEGVLRRDRMIVLLAIAGISILAWGYVLWLVAGMGMASAPRAGGAMAGMDMPGMSMPGAALAPALRPFGIAEAVFMLGMWSVMMIGMMTPSAAPMLLLYASAGRKALSGGRPFASTGWFAAGYLSAWIAFSVAAAGAQWMLTRLALLTPMMESASGIFGGGVLIAAGLYQWSPLKNTCLSQCQSPLGFLMRRGGFRSDPLGALRLGAEHGAYCVGCCWMLMTLLFVGGIMNVLWIAGLSVLVLVEKAVPMGRLIPRISGALMALAGAFLLIGAM